MDWTLYWYMFPVAFGVATLAMATGIEGAAFFSPIFILLLQLEPRVAIGAALITATFGFASGVSAHMRSRLIDYRLAGELLLAAVPLALLGTGIAGWLSPIVLKSVFGLGLLLMGLVFLRTPSPGAAKLLNQSSGGPEPPAGPGRQRGNARGDEILYRVFHRAEGMALCGVGGLFMGLIGSGQGALNSYFFLRRTQIPGPVAVATGTLIVAVTTFAASLGYVAHFITGGSDVMVPVLNLVVYTIPAVVVGGQIGPLLSSRLDGYKLTRLLALIFILIGVATLGTTWRSLS